jgi:hypothetical protein
MVDEKVDVAVESQLYEQSAPLIADSFSRARIPLISIVNPHQHIIGVNNYRAGHSAGRHPGEYAPQHRDRRKPTESGNGQHLPIGSLRVERRQAAEQPIIQPISRFIHQNDSLNLQSSSDMVRLCPFRLPH